MKRAAIKHHTAIHEADPKGSAVARKILSEPTSPEPYSSQVHNLRMLAGRMRAESAETQAVLTAETARFNTQAKRTRRLEKMEKKLRDEVNSMEKELKRQHLRLNSLQEEAQEAERRHKAAVKEFVERRDQVSELEAEAELRENISAENERRLDISYNAEKENREQLAEYEERERSLGTKILQLQKYAWLFIRPKVGGPGQAGTRNFGGLVLGCIDADFINTHWKTKTRSSRSTHFCTAPNSTV